MYKYNLKELKFASELLKKSENEILDAVTSIYKIRQIYSSAIKEITTKLEILDEEFKVRYSHNPIHSINSRLKTAHSITDKLERKGVSTKFEEVDKYLNDIAGVRVVCNYTKDIYLIEELLLRQDDLTLVKRKDYIKNPKENGYRSLHIVVSVPVFLAEETKMVPVEIQIRTMAMDFWASLEHQLKYKNDVQNSEEIQQELYECAKTAELLDKKFLEIYNKINS